jgi:hypothetical protein
MAPPSVPSTAIGGSVHPSAERQFDDLASGLIARALLILAFLFVGTVGLYFLSDVAHDAHGRWADRKIAGRAGTHQVHRARTVNNTIGATPQQIDSTLE